MPKTFTSAIDEINIPMPGLVSLDIDYLFYHPSVPRQRVLLSYNGEHLGDVVVKSTCKIAFIARSPGVVRLEFPDAWRPVDVGLNVDDRLLSIGIDEITISEPHEIWAGVRSAPRDLDLLLESTGLAPQALALCFENLGVNCEFGLVQRIFGAEPLGLLRFSATPIEALLGALERRFEGLGAVGTLEVSTFGDAQEYICTDKVFGLRYHTWQYADSVSEGDLLKQEEARLPFLARKLTETLEDAEKVLVYRTFSPLEAQVVERLFRAVRSYGPNTLMIIETAPSGNVPPIREVDRDLLLANIEYKGPEHWTIAKTWIKPLVEALEVKRSRGSNAAA
jgi:hypothetical protein